MSTADDGKACCGCCAGVGGPTPVFLENRPGLSALVYRVGTHARFKEAMLAAISAKPALRALTTRDDDDPTIALLDAWATTLDVLTFYQERIANEAFLRTATERRSLLELARTIGYELRPGVASSTWLAFTLDGSPGSPREVTIPAGTRAQSLPAKSELPQSFETGEAFLAQPTWNALRPRLFEPQEIDVGAGGGAGAKEIVLAGAALGLRPGDALLLQGDPDNPSDESTWNFRLLTEVEPRPALNATRVAWKDGLKIPASLELRIFVLRQRASLFGHNAPDWKALSKALKEVYGSIFAPNNAQAQQVQELAGGNDPIGELTDWDVLPTWALEGKYVDLDAEYPRIVPGSWIVLQQHSEPWLYRVEAVESGSHSDFTLSLKRTRVELDRIFDPTLDKVKRRQTHVFAQSEELFLAEVPVEQPVAGSTVVLDRRIEGLPPGRPVIVQGKRIPAAEDDPEVAEVAFLEEAPSDPARTTLKLTGPLASIYDRATVTIFANVAPATHGETKREVLGGGNAAKKFQRFRLRQKPLTYLAAPVAGGGASTLELRVNGVLWHEAPDLYGLGPRDRKYVLRRDDERNTTVTFGDGVHGTRLPSGVENVEAVYRIGIGLPGLVGENRISLLATRPLGVKSVTNPVPATGAADPESRDQARRNAPMTVLTFDRAVSLRDYEDFALSFSGIGKAQARMLWERGQRLVHLTIAGVDGLPVDPQSALATNLRQALDRLRDPFQELEVDSFERLLFRVGLRVKVDPDHVQETVLQQVEAALREAFSFAARNLGQSVHLSEVMAVAQRVEGVVYVDIDHLYKEEDPITLEDRLSARPARIEAGKARPADSLVLSPAPVAPEAIL